MIGRIRSAEKPEPRSWSGSATQERLRIDIAAGDANREVERRSPPVGSRAADDLASPHLRAAAHRCPGEIRIGRPQPAVIDRHRSVPHDDTREGDDARVGRTNRGPNLGGEVGPPMPAVPADRGEPIDDRSIEGGGQADAGRQQSGDQDERQHEFPSALPHRHRIEWTAMAEGSRVNPLRPRRLRAWPARRCADPTLCTASATPRRPGSALSPRSRSLPTRSSPRREHGRLPDRP